MRNLHALIPARAGSQRLPGKNIAMVGGKPMVEWSIIAARQSKMFDKIIVSTNDVRVRDIARRYDDLIVVNQPDFEQNDKASERVVRHALELQYSSYMMLLQPTSPLRTERHIREAWSLFDQSFPSNSLVSVNPNKKINGAIYLFTASRIWKGQGIYDDDALLYEMEFAASVDVDTQADLDLAQKMMQ